MELLYVFLGLLVLYLFMNKCGCGIIEGASNNGVFPRGYDVLTRRRTTEPSPGLEGSCCLPDTCNKGYECDGDGFWGQYCKGDIGGGGWQSVDLGFMAFPAWGACKRKVENWPGS